MADFPPRGRSGRSGKVRRPLRDQQHDHHAPDDEQRIADSIGDRVTHRGDVALDRLLDGAQRRRGGPRPRDAPQRQRIVEPEEVTSDEDARDERNRGRGRADQKETPPYLLKSLNEGRAGRNADDGDEGVQADVVHEPQRRLRDIAHVGITGMEPTAEKAGDQHAAAHRKAQRHGPDTGHQQPAEEQSAQKDAQPHQRHPRLFRDRIAEPERRRGAAHVLRQADQFEPVAGIELAAGQHRNLHAGTQDRTDIHTVHFFPMQNVKLNHYIAVFERVVLLCKICEQQTSNRIESLAIESGCIRG